MKLVAGVTYKVGFKMPAGNIMVCRLNYGGGSLADSEGHWIDGGVWYHPATTHPNYRSFSNSRGINRDEIRAGMYVLPGSGETDISVYLDNGKCWPKRTPEQQRSSYHTPRTRRRYQRAMIRLGRSVTIGGPLEGDLEPTDIHEAMEAAGGLTLDEIYGELPDPAGHARNDGRDNLSQGYPDGPDDSEIRDTNPPQGDVQTADAPDGR